MAEEVQKTAQEQETQQEVPEVVVVTNDVPVVAPTPPVTVVEKEQPRVPETEEEAVKPKTVVEETKNGDDQEKLVTHESGSFKEETTKVSDLSDSEKKALGELKRIVQEALNKHEFTTKTEVEASKPPEAAPVQDESSDDSVAVVDENKTAEEEMVEANEEQKNGNVDDDGAKTVEAIEETIVAVSSTQQQEQNENNSLPSKHAEKIVNTTQDSAESKDAKSEPALPPPEEISIWGIPLLADERSDVILLKFLRARDFKVKDAFTMLKNTIAWREEFRIDELIEEDLGCGSDLEKVVFMHGFAKEGHPVCYNVYGEFQNKELYQKTFSDEEKTQRFLKWRIQFLEKSIRKLDFRPGGISTIVQVTDLKNSPGLAKKELRQATKQALLLLQDNYPEFVARQVFINVPWWYLAVNKMISPFLTQRARSKFVFAGPSKSADTLLRFITAEQLPVKYGGLMSKDGEFDTADAVTEITVKPAAKHSVEFPVSEACDIAWEVRVMGWDVSYAAEFVPSADDSYTVIIQKSRKVSANEDLGVVCNSFKVGEPGKVVITIDNATSKKKKLLYRLKTKCSSN